MKKTKDKDFSEMTAYEIGKFLDDNHYTNLYLNYIGNDLEGEWVYSYDTKHVKKYIIEKGKDFNILWGFNRNAEFYFKNKQELDEFVDKYSFKMKYGNDVKFLNCDDEVWWKININSKKGKKNI